tara:strand:+ start:438 stop:776 length:339 start_codon:yes stop_codon:yes gene_type:complete
LRFVQVTKNNEGALPMTEERITRHTDEEGHTHTTHTVVTDGERKRGGGASTILLVIVAIVAIVAAVMIFGNMSNSEVAKDNAIGDAASEVGEAANQAGDAIEGAADRVAPSE